MASTAKAADLFDLATEDLDGCQLIAFCIFLVGWFNAVLDLNGTVTRKAFQDGCARARASVIAEGVL